jgi:hypothetical protein
MGIWALNGMLYTSVPIKQVSGIVNTTGARRGSDE